MPAAVKPTRFRPDLMESWHARCETLALGFRTSFSAGARGTRKFLDELNDLGWDLRLQAQKVENEAQKAEELHTPLEFLCKDFRQNPKSSYIYSDYWQKERPMYISLKDSCAKGFNKWAEAYQPEIKNDLGASESKGLAVASPDEDNLVMTSRERPHRPWLVPGTGTL